MENQKEMVEFVKWIATLIVVINGMTQQEGKKSLQELFAKFQSISKTLVNLKMEVVLTRWIYRSTINQYMKDCMTPNRNLSTG